MKLEQIFEGKKKRDEDDNLKQVPPPGELGEFITTAQAAKIIGVHRSRIRQFIMEKRLKTYAPEPGRRDNLLKLSEVEAFKTEDRDITGRPPESAEAKQKQKKAAKKKK